MCEDHLVKIIQADEALQALQALHTAYEEYKLGGLIPEQ